MTSITELSPTEVALAGDARQSDAAAQRRPRGLERVTTALATTIYVGIHLSTLLVFYTGVTAEALALFAATFFVRMFAITGVYHRYFSHRTYRTSRFVQFLLAFLGTTAVQKGPLWWASTHRLHHRYSDHEGDPHSPRLRGFRYAHQGWIFDERWDATREEQIKDLMRYPELVWLNKWHFLAPALLAWGCYAIGGFTGLVWGFAVSTTLLWHATYSINSLAHKFGRVRFETGDDSRNNWWLALLTLGEGWHNNHHYYQSTVRQGFYWWEIDVSWYVLRALAAVGLVWDLKLPPERVYAEARARREAAEQRAA